MIKNLKNKNRFIKSLLFIVLIIIIFHTSGFTSHEKNKIGKCFPPDTIWVYDTIFQYDTVYVYETVYDTIFVYDTVEIADNNDDSIIDLPQKENIFSKISIPEFKNQVKYYAGSELSIFNTNHFFINSQNIEKELYQLYKNSSKFYPGFSLGFNLDFLIKTINFQTGIYFTDIFENFDFNLNYTKTDTIIFYDFFQNYNLEIDTIQYIDLDALLHGDTIWKQHYDSIYHYFKDSTLTTEYNNTEINLNKNSKNQYRYFEFPLIFGYSLERKNFNFIPKFGFIFGFYNSSSGFSFDKTTEFEFISIPKTYLFPHLTINSFFSLSIEYKINRKVKFNIEPFFRNNLNPVFTNSQIDKYFYSYGMKFGIKVKL